MASTRPPSGIERQISSTVRRRVEADGDRLWRLKDFDDMPPSAVAQALSRLSRLGILQRLSKGTYYRSKDTAFGKSLPNPAAVQKLGAEHRPVFPAGISAANLLGFTTQHPTRVELATTARSLPRKLIGADIIVHTGRPTAWSRLSSLEACLLDFLRNRGSWSELPPEQTIRRLQTLLAEPGRLQRLEDVAATEPPRVRAMLGALAERLGESRVALDRLRRTLNPLSRFDFGILSVLPNARAWYAREQE